MSISGGVLKKVLCRLATARRVGLTGREIYSALEREDPLAFYVIALGEADLASDQFRRGSTYFLGLAEDALNAGNTENIRMANHAT